MKEVREKIDEILERLPPPPTVAPGSPVRLTDFGKEISHSLGAKKWSADQAAGLLVYVIEKFA